VFKRVAPILILITIIISGCGKSDQSPPAPTAEELVTAGCKNYNSKAALQKFSTAAELDEKFRMLAVSASSLQNSQVLLKSGKLDPKVGQQLALRTLQDLAVIQSFCAKG
jgi:hypothetical protein